MSNEIRGTVPTNETLIGDLNAARGYDGKSAYELAVRNGFEGTEVEWLASLGEIHKDTEFIFVGGDANQKLSVDFSVDNRMSSTSTNPIANGVVKKYIDENTEEAKDYIDSSIEETKKYVDSNIEELNKKILPVDSEVSDTSENAISNKATKTYVDSKIEVVNSKIYPIDSGMSDTSENPVMNKAVKAYVDRAMDYIVEQGETEDGWTYRKWNSGIVELWGGTSVRTTFTNKIGDGHYAGDAFPQKDYPLICIQRY